MPVRLLFEMIIADIHCHILPYVDDGALTFDVTEELLAQMYRQGIRYICCTPHLRYGMFECPDEEVKRQFTRVQHYAFGQYGTGLQLFLSREYHYDRLFREKLKKDKILPLGRSGHILMEFSRRHTKEDVEAAVQEVRAYGFTPVIAHVERYRKEVCDPGEVERLKDLGARVQLNAAAVLGKGGLSESSACKKLLKANLVDVVASDAHDPEDRPSEDEKAAQYLEKKYGSSLAEELLYTNPLQMLGIRKEKG